MNILLSDEFKAILSCARDEAMRTGHYGIGADHLMLAILRHRDNGACRILEEAGISPEDFKSGIDGAIFRDKSIPYYDGEKIRPTPAAAAVVSIAAYESLRSGKGMVFSTHLLLAISRAEGSASRSYLTGRSLGYTALRRLLADKGMLEESGRGDTVKMKEVAAALGEQLGRLFSGSGGTYLS